MRRFKKTRIAPTPSGFCHLGNALSFVITAGLARRCGATILLRIDDLDRERFREEYLEDIFETLRFLEIEWDEGPVNGTDFLNKWSQHHRSRLYTSELERLLANGEVFGCICSRSQFNPDRSKAYPGTCMGKNLPIDTKNTAWRLQNVPVEQLEINSMPEGRITDFLPKEMHHLVVRKKSEDPSYQLGSVVDDLHFGIDLIIRGKDLYPSTLAQVHLAGLLGHDEFNDITFHHHALLCSKEGQKLSKTEGAESIRFLRQSGKTRTEVLAMILDSAGGHGAPTNWQDCFSALPGYNET